MKVKELTAAQASKLRMSKYNRELRSEHVSEIVTGFTNNFELIPPIQITADNVIIDGSHRCAAFLMAIEQGKLPQNARLSAIVLNMEKEKEKEAIKITNAKHKSYTLPDYIKMNVADGINDYKVLEDWCRNHELCVSTAHRQFRLKHAFACAFLLGRRSDAALRSGALRITPEDIEMGNIIYNEINELRHILGWQISTIRYDLFAQIWRDMRDEHTFSEWKKEFKAQAPHIQRQIPYTIRGFHQFLDAINSAISRKKKAAEKRRAKKAEA